MWKYATAFPIESGDGVGVSVDRDGSFFRGVSNGLLAFALIFK